MSLVLVFNVISPTPLCSTYIELVLFALELDPVVFTFFIISFVDSAVASVECWSKNGFVKSVSER